MGHPFRIREIAAQAGLSEATVDRVLHRRGGVRESTIREVETAIEDLRRQQSQVRLVGRTFLVDLVMQAPERFSAAARNALEQELPSLQPAVMRSRFHLRETGPVEELVATLERIARHGSHGVVLKAPDVPEVSDAVGHLADAGIPVVTLVTDIPRSRRVSYAGMDNRAAGATAAYVLSQWLGQTPGNVLVTLSRSFFRGEEEREMGFRSAMRQQQPHRQLVDIPDTDGVDATVRHRVDEALAADPDLDAVYSIGGGNAATLDAFAAAGRECRVFLAHDLDQENLRLLRAGRLSAVLYHDLAQDMRRACHAIMQAHHALPGAPLTWHSSTQVATPYNLPSPAPPDAP